MADNLRDARGQLPLQGKLVTIFGGSGFVGRHLVRRLAKSGARIRVAVRRPNEAHFLKPLGAVGQIMPIQANVRNAASVARAVEGADIVINLVGILVESGRQTFRALQAEGAAKVASAAAAAGVTQYVQMSAIGADPESPSAYARTKAAGEVAAREHMPGATVIRPSIVFGPEDEFFNRFAAMARISPFLPLIGDGSTRFQPVYVADVAEAIARTLENPALGGETYELGGPNVYTFRELMELTLRIIGRKRLLLPLPVPVARAQATMFEMLPLITPPITRDQIAQLTRDNVVAEGAKTLETLGIDAATAEAIVPTYLYRFRKHGQFTGSTYDATGTPTEA